MNDNIERRKNILVITKRLVILAAVSLIVSAIIFAVTFVFANRLMISWLVFECGIIGGFVSIQQRLKNIDNDELKLLSEAWSTILIIPVYGGIFALVLYVLFLSGLVAGNLFPQFAIPRVEVPTTDNIRDFLTQTYPQTGQDLAKLIFWSFVSGFSERFVPQIIHSVIKQERK